MNKEYDYTQQSRRVTFEVAKLDIYDNSTTNVNRPLSLAFIKAACEHKIKNQK